MGTQPTRSSVRFLPQVAAATLAVVGGPVFAISMLRTSGVVTSTILLVAVGVVLSIGVSYAGATFWMTRQASGDLLFGDLMLWGWLKRWRVEKRLTSAVKLLGLKGHSRRGEALDLAPGRRTALLKQLVAAMETRDPYTHGHSRRVARHASMIAKRMGLSGEQVARIRAAAAVHDVGKLHTSAKIINKPGRLSDAEFAVIKLHSSIGAQMVTGLGDGELVRIVRHHHERLDGMGYPDGLTGDEIPLGARIIAVADTFDAITSERPYRAAKPHKEALQLLSAEAGSQLDPAAVRAFRSYYSGRRPVALWALLIDGGQRLISSLITEQSLGGVATAAKVTAATLATVAAGSALVQSPQAAQQSQGSRSPGSVTQRSATSSQAGRALRLAAVDSPRTHRSRIGAGSEAGGAGASPVAPVNPGNRNAGSEPGGSAPLPSKSIGSSPAEPSAGESSSQGKLTPPEPSAVAPVNSTVQTVGTLPENAVGPLPVKTVTLLPVPNVNSLVPKLPAVGLGGG